MKRKELVSLLEKNKWYLLRHGLKHDIYTNGIDMEPIPRHTEIDHNLAKKIIRTRGLK